MSVDIGDLNQFIGLTVVMDITYIGKSRHIANDEGKAIIVPPSDAGITGINHVVGFCQNQGRELKRW